MMANREFDGPNPIPRRDDDRREAYRRQNLRRLRVGGDQPAPEGVQQPRDVEDDRRRLGIARRGLGQAIEGRDQAARRRAGDVRRRDQDGEGRGPEVILDQGEIRNGLEGRRRGQDIRGRGRGRDERGRGRGSGGAGRGGMRNMGYRALNELSTREAGEIVLTLTHRNSGLRDALIKSQEDYGIMKALLKVLAKASSTSSLPQNLLEVFVAIKDEGFFDTTVRYFITVNANLDNLASREKEDVKQALKDIIALVSKLCSQMPNAITQFLGIHSVLDSLIRTLRQRSELMDEEIIESFMELTEQKDALQQSFQSRNRPKGRRDDRRFEEKQPPDDFREIAIFPQTADLQVDDGPFLRANKAKGEYTDLNHYLDVQFRLLREDFIGPLREGIANYMEAVQEVGKKRIKQEIRIYQNVQIIAPICGDMGLCHILKFDVSGMGNIRWQNSKRLIYGSLVCLSSDNFRTFHFATVADRDLKQLEQGNIIVRFEEANVRELMSTAYTMAETTAYFESYRHVLLGLKNTQQGDLPFERYVIKCTNDVNPPSYVNRLGACHFDLRPLVDEDVILHADSRLERAGQVVENRRALHFTAHSKPAKDVNLLDRSTWPPADLLHIDASQYQAINTALTKELAIIQGPPGTGKTYIGLKIVKALLHNRQVWSVNPNTGVKDPRPMLIVCYTNHALDQFLEGIVKFFKGDILRVGGRGSSDILKEYNLNNFRQRFRHAQKITTAVFQGRRQAKSEMESVRHKIDKSGTMIQMAKSNVLHEDFLRPVMGHFYQRLIQQFEEVLCQVEGQGLAFNQKSSVIVEWLELGSFSENFDLAAAMQVLAIAPDPQEEEEQNREEMIEADDEVDALFAQRFLNVEDMDEYMDQASVRQRRERDMASIQSRAVALDVMKLDNKSMGEIEGQWQMQRGQKKKMKKDVQRRLASNDIMTTEEARRVRNLWQMEIAEKWRLYRMWVDMYCQQLIADIQDKEEEYEEASARYREALMQEDREIMTQATVIGMTTTGAAKYQAILQEIQPRIIVVEEAAEVLEAHIVTTLNRGCDHLILIGDHKQLKPNPTVYKLATKFNLEISLFERMINNGIKCDCLELQHRMRPEIAELMKPIYENLRNHEDVNNYENIKGVVHNLFFINHNYPEKSDDDIRSHSNDHEAEYISSLCNFLLLQGYEPSQITVLTLYSGQLFNLKKRMPKSRFEGVRLTVVDNYQGEENDIILLSLVRSEKAGFLKIDNRVCVALSRAKKAFYVIGNFDMLSGSSKLWSEITIQMNRRGLLGEALQLSCQNHPEDEGILATLPSDFDKAPEGGCSRKCDARLQCGHSCEMYCHVQDQLHTKYKCKKPCAKQVCANKHRCTKKCFEKCGDCMVLVPKLLHRCQHEQMVPCYMNPDTFVCQEECSLTLVCGHKCQKKCGEAHTRNCSQIIQHTWPCGHKGNIRCFEKETANCRKKCSDELKCGDICGGTCGTCFQRRLHESCTNKCNRPLVCGHECLSSCNNCPPCSRHCQNRCTHSRCNKRCGIPCVPCKEACTWNCAHYKCSMLCSEPCDRPRCNRPCRKRLECGHECIGLCGETCPQLCRICDEEKVTTILFGDEDEPGARFVYLEDCMHIVEYKAMDKYMDEDTSGNGEIQLRTCPICKTPIRKNKRYGTIINRTLQDVESIKRRMIGNEDRIKELNARIKRRVLLLDTSDRFTIETRLAQKTHANHSEGSLVALENQITFLESLQNLMKKAAKLNSLENINDGKKIKAFMKKFHEWILKERDIMSDQETSDARQELLRLEGYIQLLLYLQNARTRNTKLDEQTKKEVRDADRICTDLKPFTEERQARMKFCLERLKERSPLSGLAVSERERIQIVNALSMGKGHWFKCPNGHYYAIGDCGGATMESQCPECKAKIGGHSHRIRSDNRFAPEMDGAASPAWPTVAHLDEYDLDD